MRPVHANGKRDQDGNTISPGSEANYQMVDGIIAELAALFPFGYIDIGGDEVNTGAWNDSPEIQNLIKREKLDGIGAVQAYFTRRLETILTAHHRKMIGWNEITNDKLSRTTAIMSWKNTGPGYNAARMGFQVVQAPAQNTYFDMPYPNNNDEPPALYWAGATDCARCYSLDPQGDKGLTPEQAAHIMGVEGCLWTEKVYPWSSESGWCDLKTIGEAADYKTLPRLCALSEVAWTPQEQRNYEDFNNRLGNGHLQRLAFAGYVFRVAPPDAAMRQGAIQITPATPGTEIRYTTDGSDPFKSSTARVWSGEPVHCVPGQFRARAYVQGRPGPLHAGAKLEVVGHWKNDGVGKEFSPVTYDLGNEVGQAGIWTLTFHKTGGKHDLLVRNVELLVNDVPVAQDNHDGGTAGNGAYRLHVTAPIKQGDRVTLRAEIKADAGAGAPDTNGELLLDGMFPAGHWQASDLAAPLKPVTVDLGGAVDQAGVYRVELCQTSGKDAVVVRSVVLSENGRDIASVSPNARCGADGKPVCISLPVGKADPSARYGLRVLAEPGGGTDSGGEIWVAKIATLDVAPSYKPGSVLANWSPDKLQGDNYGIAQIDLPDGIINKPGAYRLSFQYTRGACAAEFKNVELLAGSTVIASDAHEGHSGSSTQDNQYTLACPSLPAAGKYSIQFQIQGLGGADSYGEIRLAQP